MRERREMAVSMKEIEIVKPRTDKREYKRVVLSNSLEVLLISDPETDKAAASMNVDVGSFSDPDGLEGLAHFLEHMLFFASEKYPVENSYLKYITEHGGSTNAFTGSDKTNFHFDVNADSFEEALDRFAQFFIKPLMSPDATLREIKAVDSENKKNLLNDGWRMCQLQKHLSSEEHPFHKFNTGNWNTLEVVPKAKGVDTRSELVRFYKENYSANLMHLVVYGRESIDYIQSLVEKKFQDVPNTGRNAIHFSGQPCTSEHLEILVKTVPVKDGHKLHVTWPITHGIHYYKEGPCAYLSHLIGHEGEGSLFFILKKLGWAVSLSAAEGEWIYDFCFFSVVIMLTDAGHDHVEDIIGLLFRYILLLQNSGVKEWIFNELVAICEMGFHFQDKISPVLYATNIASNMQQYPPEDWLVASSFPSKFDPNIIQMVLGQLTARNVRIFWESKKFEGHFKLVEPWYCTPYSIEKISASLVQQWVEKAPNEPLHLPAINKFIPTDLSIKNVQNQVKFPILLRSRSFARLWYKPDTIFHTPKACVRLDFICPLSNNSPEAEALTDIFTRLLTDSLNEFAYDARVAGLYYGIYCTETGFQIAVGGYNAKMKLLLKEIVGKIAKFEVKAERFSVIKETVMKDYQNFKFQQPYEQALYYRSLLLSEKTWPLSETLDVLPQLEVDHLVKFIPQILSKVFLEGFVTGNVEASEAESILKYIEGIFFEGPHPISTPLFPSQHLADRTIKLEKGVRYYHPVNAQNQNEENSALVHYVQIHRDEIKLNVKLQLFALIASQPAYDQLRSVEQLGYVVVLMERNDAGIWGLQIIIQSSVKNPPDLDSRVEAFLKNFENTLCEMTVEEYESNVNALINMKLEKYKNLWEESSFYWGEIADGTLRFDRKESEAAALRDLTHQELMEFFEEHIKVGALKRKTLCVQVYGGQHSEEYRKAKSDPSQPTNVRIDDICNFRRSMPLYGSFKGVFVQMKL